MCEIGAKSARVAVRIRLRHVRRRERPAGAGPVVDDEGLAHRLGHLGCYQARDDVGHAAGGERNDDADGLVRVCRLGERSRRRHQHETGYRRDQARRQGHLFPPRSVAGGMRRAGPD
jgi:hypothetical protein